MATEGEGKLLLEQIRVLSSEILENLMEIDDKLASLQESVQIGESLDRASAIDKIREIRIVIGVMEKEDTEEIEDEKILQNMIQKLNNLINMTL